MSTPEQPAETQTVPDVPWCTEEDNIAAARSAHWFHLHAPPELIERYRGMHVAILGEQIIDGDRDFDTLGRRVEAQADTIPLNRVLFRYIPTDDESLRFRY